MVDTAVSHANRNVMNVSFQMCVTGLDRFKISAAPFIATTTIEAEH